jgi:hypothetical protein
MGMNDQEKIKEVAEEILSNKEMLSYMRAYLWDGFAAHNIAYYYESQTGKFPFKGSDLDYIQAWWAVRELVYPKVKELKDLHGEFGEIR